ncbi:MAG: hypothetical protein H0U85_00675 [Gemmatimonadales bacterium]|nr:hypothetical protein [Gemmatimonadales bacterium]
MLGVETVIPIAAFVSAVVVILGVTKAIMDGLTRRRLILAGLTAEVARAITPAIRDDIGIYSALKWGMVAMTAGLALVIIQFLPYDGNSPMVAGVVLLFVGAGLLGYWAVTRRLAGRAQ